MRGCRAAFIFLTRFPIGGFPFSRDDWRWSTAYFPFVGAALGLLQATLAAILLPHLGAASTALFVVGASMMMTGAFHEDGLADSADGLGGAYDREKLFVILKDSRIGTFGAAALFVGLGLRVTLLVSLGEAMPLALLLTQCAARTPPIWLMRMLPYVTADGEAKSRLVARAGRAQTFVATFWPTALVAGAVYHGALAPSRALALGIAMVVVALVCAWRFRARAGGLTGDFLGATEQVGEVALLAVLVWV